MASSIVDFLSKQQKPLTDALKGTVAIAAISPTTPVYEAVKKTGEDSGRVVINYPAGSKIGIIQEVGYIGQKLFAKVALYTYFSHPFKAGAVIKQVLVPIERLLYEPKPVSVNKVELYALGNNTNVRHSSSIYSKSIELYDKGQLTGSTEGSLVASSDRISSKKWYKITSSTGKTGYIREDVVSTSKPSASPIPVPVGSNQVTPTAEQKGAELDRDVLETESTPFRKVLYYGGIALLVGIGWWVVNNFIKRNGSKK